MHRAIKRARLLEPSWTASTCTQSLHSSAPQLIPKTESKSSGPRYLPRPLGVQHPPVRADLAAPSTKSRFLSAEGRQAERKTITKELSKSYFQDFSTLSQTGGKLWLAPETVIKAEVRLICANASLSGIDQC